MVLQAVNTGSSPPGRKVEGAGANSDSATGTERPGGHWQKAASLGGVGADASSKALLTSQHVAMDDLQQRMLVPLCACCVIPIATLGQQQLAVGCNGQRYTSQSGQQTLAKYTAQALFDAVLHLHG